MFEIDRNIIKIINSDEPQSDFEYWQSRPVMERFMALESLRQQFYNYNDSTISRIQKVCRIIEQ